MFHVQFHYTHGTVVLEKERRFNSRCNKLLVLRGAMSKCYNEDYGIPLIVTSCSSTFLKALKFCIIAATTPLKFTSHQI